MTRITVGPPPQSLAAILHEAVTGVLRHTHSRLSKLAWRGFLVFEKDGGKGERGLDIHSAPSSRRHPRAKQVRRGLSARCSSNRLLVQVFLICVSSFWLEVNSLGNDRLRLGPEDSPL